MDDDFNNTLEKERWKYHPLYNDRRSILEEKLSKEGLDSRGAKHTLVRRLVKKRGMNELEMICDFSGDISEMPVHAREIRKLPPAKLKQILKFFNVPTEGTKDQLILRVLVVHSGTRHLLFGKEADELISLVDLIMNSLIWKQKEQAIMSDSIKYRERAFQTLEKSTVSLSRPWESAGVVKPEKANEGHADCLQVI